MAKPGPKPKDPRLDKLDGNPGKRPPKPDPLKATGDPTPPDFLGEYSLTIWNQIIGSMPPNFYAVADTMLLASYCQACNMARWSSEEIEEKGITLTNQQGNTVRNPATQVLSDAMSKIISIGNNLGLDPSARQSMGITAGRDNPDGGEGNAGSKFGDLVTIDGGKGAA